MNDKKLYWVWMSQAISTGKKTAEMLAAFPDPEELYRASDNERMAQGVFSIPQLERMKKLSLKNAETTLRVCEQNGWSICTPDDDDYPEELRKIISMPIVLYVDGDLSKIKGKMTVAMVGTRKPTDEGLCIARTIAGDLAHAGVAVISGGALGIDGASHEGVLNENGVTVCVLGCGLGTKYLKKNEYLREKIRKTGALVSEFQPFEGVSKYNFPTRNRLVSGMSKGVVVVEAGVKSGSLITAGCAIEQGKDLFAIPGSVFDSAHVGCNKLIMNGAKAITCAADVLAPYAAIYPELVDTSKIRVTKPVLERPKEEKPAKIKKEAPPTLDPDALTVYNLFGEEPLHTDDITVQSGLSPSKVLSSLMRLELLGLIRQTDGRKYILKS